MAIEMKRCPDCRAPNPQNRTTCYACGQSLDRRPANAPLPGEPTYPCLNCGVAVPHRASACPGCGRVTSAPPPIPAQVQASWGDPLSGAKSADLLMLGPVPDGWEVEPLPDGTVRMRRGSWARVRASAVPLSAAVFMVVYFVLQGVLSAALGGFRGEATPRVPVVGVLTLALLGTAAAVYLLWVFVAKEEVRVGPGMLEVRQELWGYRRAQRMTMGMLRAETREYWSRNGGRRQVRRLVVQNLGKRITLDSRERPTLLGLSLESGADGMTALGAYLSRVTGWPFVDPENGRY